MAGTSSSPAIFQQLISIETGQHDIQKRQIKGFFFQEIRRLRAVGGPNAAVARVGQNGTDQVRDGRLVLRDQDLIHLTHPLFLFIHII